MLDPYGSIQIGDDLIKIYQDRIDALINQLGKNILMEFPPVVAECPNCYADNMNKRSTGVYKPGGPTSFPRGQRCPTCNGEGALYTKETKCIKALLKWNPKDAETFGISIQDSRGIVRIKTYLTELDDLKRAATILVNYDIAGQVELRTKLLKGPIPVGLREDRYCISFWELTS